MNNVIRYTVHTKNFPILTHLGLLFMCSMHMASNSRIYSHMQKNSAEPLIPCVRIIVKNYVCDFFMTPGIYSTRTKKKSKKAKNFVNGATESKFRTFDYNISSLSKSCSKIYFSIPIMGPIGYFSEK